MVRSCKNTLHSRRVECGFSRVVYIRMGVGVVFAKGTSEHSEDLIQNDWLCGWASRQALTDTSRKSLLSPGASLLAGARECAVEGAFSERAFNVNVN